MAIFSYQVQNGETRYGFRIRTGEPGDRRICRKGFLTRERADRALRQLLHERDEGRLRAGARQRDQVLLEDFLQQVFLPWVREHRKASTTRCYEICATNLQRIFSGYRMAGITHRHLYEYITARRRENVKNATINRDLAILRAAMRKAVRWGYLQANPIDGMELLKEERRERTLTMAEVRRLLANLPNRLRVWAGLAVFTGMRKQEILDLLWEDVDFRDGYAYVRSGKTDAATRTVPLDRNALAILASLPHRDGFVLRGPKGGQMHWTGRDHKAWKKAVSASGLGDLRPHDLRHVFATRALEDGVHVLTLARILGQTSTAMVARYAHVTDRQIRQARILLNRSAATIWPLEKTAGQADEA